MPPRTSVLRRESRAHLASLPLAVAGLVLLAACGDSRLRNLEVGIGKDSLIKLLGEGAPAGDSLPNLYKHEQYFVDGKMFDIYMYDAKNRKAWLDPLVTDEELTPLVVVDGKLAGTGWNHMDGVTDQYRIEARRAPK